MFIKKIYNISLSLNHTIENQQKMSKEGYRINLKNFW